MSEWFDVLYIRILLWNIELNAKCGPIKLTKISNYGCAIENYINGVGFI